MATNGGNIFDLEEVRAIMNGNIIAFEEGWAILYKAIQQLRRRLEEGDLNWPTTADECGVAYTIVYKMCADGRQEQMMYDRSKDCIREYIYSKVLPALREQTDAQLMLIEFVKRWNIHKAMLRWMDSSFNYLYRYFTVRLSLPSLGEVGIMYFRDLVFPVMRKMATNGGNIFDLEEGRAIMKGNIIALEEGWAILYKAILQLRRRLEDGDLNSPMTADECIVVYSIVYKMCADGRQKQMIYDRSQDCIREYIYSKVLPALTEQTDAQLMLIELVKRWNIHKAMLRWMDSSFNYLYRCYTLILSLPSLGEVGIMYFRDLVFRVMRINVKNAVIALIDQEREREQTNGTLLKDVVAIFVEVDMDFYTNDFEVAMLEHTGAYYSRKAVPWILEDSYTECMSKVEGCLIREKDRVAKYLHGSSEQKLLDTVETGLLSRYMTHFLEDQHSGCLALLRDHRKEDILMMHRLFDRIPNGWKSVANIFKQYVIGEVTPLVKQAEDAIKHDSGRREKSILLPEVASFVRMVIELRDKHMKYAVDVFQHNTIFSSALKEAFEVFCNKIIAGTTIAEWLARLCDSVLKKDSSNKMLIRDDIIKNVVEFVEYISDKDMFANFYRKKLTRRVLIDRSANVDPEQSILSKLTQKCGCQLTSKMRSMLTDFSTSLKSQSRFEAYLNNNRNIHLGIEFNVTVLATGIWPTFKSSEINLPAEMARCMEVFKEFYSSEGQDRQLTWIYSLGTCNIIGKFVGGPIEMIATTYQAAILLLFNASEKLSYSDIRTQLNLSEEEIGKLLYSLSCDKFKILLKHPDTTTIGTADYFEINVNFIHGTGKLKIPMPLLHEKTNGTELHEKINGTEDIYKDRCFVIDASIVRIMKRQKVLPYKELVTECAQQLGRTFNSEIIREVKKRIEDLINREYLERDSEKLRYIP